MDCDCGTTIGRVAALGIAAARWTACACVAGALAASGASAATPSHPRPQPERLWRAYPLTPAETTIARDRGRAASVQQSRPARPQRATETAAADGSRASSTTSWLAIGLVVAAAVAAAFVLLRMRLVGDWRHGPVQLPVAPALAWATRHLRPFRPPASHVRSSSSKPIPSKRGRVPKKQRKPPPSDVAVLKGKRRTGGATVEKPLQPAHTGTVTGAPREDVALLRAKRAETERPPTVASPTRASPSTRPAPSVPRCRIVWWRGYVRSEFHARLAEPDGDGPCIATSPPFRWRKSIPPPRDLVPAAAAHARLVAALEADGWAVAAAGSDWFSVELRRELPEQLPNQQRRIR